MREAPTPRRPEAAPAYLLLTAGTTGDVLPFMGLARALQAVGRSVCLFTPRFHDGLFAGTGLPQVGLGSVAEVEQLLRHPDAWHPRRGFAALFADYRRPLLQAVAAVRAHAGPRPVALLAHPLAMPAAAALRELGVVDRVAALHLAPATLRSCHDPMRLGELTVPRWLPMAWRRRLWRLTEARWIDPVALRQTDLARHELGLPPLRSSFLTHIEQAADLTVTLFPPWFGPAPPDWPAARLAGDFARFDPRAGAAPTPALAAFLAGGPPPLVFTPGTGHRQAQAFFAAALAASAALGQRALLLTSAREQLPDRLPDSACWQPYVPLADLLPQARAFVHHGGIGSTAEALRAGIPQLVTPFAWDQFDNAARVAALGAGRVLPAARLRADRLRRVLHELLTCAPTASACRQIAARCTDPPFPPAWCARLEAALWAPGAAA